MESSNADGYAAAVVSVLASEFPAMAEPHTASLVRDAINRHRAKLQPSFEVIVDSPTLANWRLRTHLEHPSRVRLACYRLQQTSTDDARVQRINTALDQIPD